MRSLRKLVGILLLAAISTLGVPCVFAGPQELPGVATNGPQESPGSSGPQESPGILYDNTTDITTELILYVILKAIP